jgi:hypothetical protein
MLSEISQSHKERYHMFFLICEMPIMGGYRDMGEDMESRG